MIRIKRVYDPPGKDDGYRVLIDRLWPRGKRKRDLRIDAWLKDVAPSDSLRKWFAHDPKRWDEFVQRYQQELRSAEATEIAKDLARRASQGPVTLIYSARDEKHNNAVVLREWIEKASG